MPIKKAKSFFTTNEASVYLRVSKFWLYRHAGKPGGPPHYKIGNVLRFDKGELDAWLNEHRRVKGIFPDLDLSALNFHLDLDSLKAEPPNHDVLKPGGVDE
jgi:excisionase family DNA binding protein